MFIIKERGDIVEMFCNFPEKQPHTFADRPGRFGCQRGVFDELPPHFRGRSCTKMEIADMRYEI